MIEDLDWSKGGNWVRVIVPRIRRNFALYFYSDNQLLGGIPDNDNVDITDLINTPDMLLMVCPFIDIDILYEMLQAWCESDPGKKNSNPVWGGVVKSFKEVEVHYI